MLINNILGKCARPGHGHGQPPRFPTFGCQLTQPFSTAIHIIRCAEMDEQHSYPYGCGENEGANMARMRKHLRPSNTTNSESNHMFPMWKGRTFCQNCSQQHVGFNNRHPSTSSYANFDNDLVLAGSIAAPTEDRIACLKAELDAMTLEDKEQLAKEMGQDEDFPSA